MTGTQCWEVWKGWTEIIEQNENIGENKEIWEKLKSKKVVKDADVANENGEKRCKILRILVKVIRATRLSSQWET